MGPADRHMTFRKGLSSSNRYMAHPRRRVSLPVVPADLRLPDHIRRPVSASAGRGPQPMRVNYFFAILGESFQRMAGPTTRYSIALPDMTQFRGL